MSKKTYLASLPWFPGFYNSSLDGMMDNEIEDSEYSSEEIEKLYSEGKFNFLRGRLEITKQWVNVFAKETGLEMTFDELNSPKEYNFSNDRVFVYLTQDALDKIKVHAKSDEFRQIVEDECTSRSGFISFYSNDIEQGVWLKPIEEWDHNQLNLLIKAYTMIESEGEDLVDTIEGTPCVYEAAQYIMP